VARAEPGQPLLGVPGPGQREPPQTLAGRGRHLDHDVLGAGLRDRHPSELRDRVAERFLRDHALGQLDELILDRPVADPRRDRPEQAVSAAAQGDRVRGAGDLDRGAHRHRVPRPSAVSARLHRTVTG
jgi:hypothetical protein